MKAVKKGGKSLVNGESKGSSRQKIDLGLEKERICKALNHVTEEEIFQKSASPPAGWSSIKDLGKEWKIKCLVERR